MPSPPRRRRKLISRRKVWTVADRAVRGFVNGLELLVTGSGRPEMGNAPRAPVYRDGKRTLWRILPRRDEEMDLGTERLVVERPRRATPVLLVPPLMVRPYVYDLLPEHSLVRALRDAGHDTYVLDFGEPDAADEGLRLDDYVLDFLPRAVAGALETSGAPRLSLVGYCMGGIFSLLHVAVARDARVGNLVAIGAPIDFEKMGSLTVLARLFADRIDPLMDRVGNIRGRWASAGFHLISGPRSVTRWADLFIRLYDREYVRGFDAMNTWIHDLIAFPRDAFKQLVRDVAGRNLLLAGQLRLGGRVADLRAVRCPVLAFAGRSDEIASPASVRALLDAVGSSDRQFVQVAGGHVGVVAGREAPAQVWRPTIDWLAARDAG